MSTVNENGNQQAVQDWRADLDAALAAKEEADRQAAEAEKQRQIEERNHYIEQVLDFARWLGIEGELVERKPDNPDDLRPIPVIVRDGYGFVFGLVKFQEQPPVRRRLNPDAPYIEDKQATVQFSLDVRRVVVESCPLSSCRYAHVARLNVRHSGDGYGHNRDLWTVTRTSDEGRDEFRVALAKRLRDLDREVTEQATAHAAYVTEQILMAERMAYAEKERREYVPPPPPEIPDEPERVEAEEPVFIEPPQPRQRIVTEGTFEWRLLALLDELRGYGYWE